MFEVESNCEYLPASRTAPFFLLHGKMWFEVYGPEHLLRSCSISMALSLQSYTMRGLALCDFCLFHTKNLPQINYLMGTVSLCSPPYLPLHS